MLSRLCRPLLLSGGLLLVASSGYALASLDATDAGWQPLVQLWGKGDKAKALTELHRLTRAFEVSLHRTQIDAQTQEFIDGTLEDLEDFNLGDFYDRLPQQNGDYRELWVRGEIQGDRYVIGQASGKRSYAVTLKGDRNLLAAMSTTVRAKPSPTIDGKDAYAISYRFGLGIGNFRWDTAMAALADWARIQTLADPRVGADKPVPSTQAARSKAKSLHPKLASEDLEVLGLLFESYPQMSPMLSRLGSVEDVRTTWNNKSYQQLSLSVKAQPTRFENDYPALARYLAHMRDLVQLDVRWSDRQGRTLLQYQLDSDKLAFAATCYVKDGQLVPFRGVKVFESEPVDPLGDALDKTTIVADMRMKLLGVVIKLSGLKLDAFYRAHPHHAEMGMSFTKVPTVQVEGAALGFVPTALLDVFIPGNIESVTRDFLTAAAHGNEGKGVVAGLKLGVAVEGSERGVLEASLDFVALDNFLVKLGLGMVNDRLIPEPRALDEAKRLATDVYDAFVKDLGRFEQRATSTVAL